MVPPIKGLQDINFLTNETLFELDKLPASLIILSGGVDGLEFASALGRLGVEVTVVEMAPRLLSGDDRELVNLLLEQLQREGINILTGTKAAGLSKKGDRIALAIELPNGEQGEIQSDALLFTIGRKAEMESLKLDNAKVKYSPRGIITNSKMQTSVPNIYACGDIVYCLYLFFDFAGYSAFAVGFSYLLGVHAPENFDRPFVSKNIKEFWTRWHISLSFWFRDFIYTPFLLLAFKKKWFKNKNHAAYAANLVTFGAMGLWHGTATQYLVYGVYHAALLSAYDAIARWNKPRPDAPGKLWGESLGWDIAAALVTFHAVCFGFLIFSGHPLW